MPDANRVEVERLGKGFHTVIARYGFTEQPDIPEALRACRPHGIAYDEMETTLLPRPRDPGARRSIPSSAAGAATGSSRSRHSASATKTFFRIPPNRAIELGNQIQI